MVDGAVFDIGGVLAHDVWEHLLLDSENGIAARYALDKEQVVRVGRLLWEAFAYRPETRNSSWQDLEKQYWCLFVDFFWGKNPPQGISVNGFIRMTDKFIRPVDEKMPMFLDQLQSRCVKLGICSNNNEFWFRRQMDKLSLHRYFSPSNVILSCRLGVSKSSPRFEMFHAAVDALCLPHSRCAFIDDREKNVKRAEECGMVGVLFRNLRQLKDSLK